MRNELHALSLFALTALVAFGCESSEDEADGGPGTSDGAAGGGGEGGMAGEGGEGGQGGDGGMAGEGGQGGDGGMAGEGGQGGMAGEGGQGGMAGEGGQGGMAGEGGQGGMAGEGGQGGMGGEVDHPISLRVVDTDVPDGGHYFHPLNGGNGRVPLFSFYTDEYSISNGGEAPVTIDDIEIIPADGVADEEFTLRNCNVDLEPYSVMDEVIEPGGSLPFDLCFVPIAGDLPPEEGFEIACEEDRDCACLGGDMDCPPIRYRGEYCYQGVCQAPRSAEVRIHYDDGQTYSFTASGRGRPKWTTRFSHGETLWAYSVGADTTDELVGGMVADPEGNLFFTANSAQVVNIFAHDILVGRLNADGSFAWLKAWSGKFQDYARDSGQNAETGGTAGSIARGDDGGIYVVGAHSNSNSNSLFYGVVLKIDPDDGSIIWQKAFGTDPPRVGNDSVEAYAVDVRGDRVYVTGTGRGVLVMAMNAADGEVVWHRSVDPAPGSVSRGYAVRADANGNLYVAGLVNGRGLLLRFTGADGAAPTLDWARRINAGRGSGINDVDVDAEGNAYLSVDRRGANTAFTGMRINADGTVGWAKSYNPKGGGDKDNTHVVYVDGDHVYLGGRVGFGEYDGQFGDGLIVRAARADGALDWASFYYGGKGAEEIAEHRIKGLQVVDGALLVAGQAYTGVNNHYEYDGYLYDGTRRPEDPSDERPFDWVNYCPEGDEACEHGRPDRPDCLPDNECTFGFEPIAAPAIIAHPDFTAIDADDAYGFDRALPPNREPSFNGYIDLSSQETVQLEGEVGAPCGAGVGDCDIVCADLDEAGCSAGAADAVCDPVPDIGAFEFCASRRGTVTHLPLRENEGVAPDGELFILKVDLD